MSISNIRITFRQWLTLFVGTLLCLSIHADPFTSEEEKFLDFDQAYQLDAPSLKEGKVYLSWQIVDGYYLYTNTFALQAVSKNQALTLALHIPPGEKKYDDILKEEHEIHHHGVEIWAELPKWSGSYQLQVTAQGCADAGLCYPPETRYFNVDNGVATPTDTALQVTEPPSGSTPMASGSPPAKKPFLLWMILGAFVGGLILNLMPCVFPVLSLKALSLASGKTKHQHWHGWAYTGGIVASFVGVAIILIVAKHAGSSLGWGFQLQQPVFVAFLCYLFFVMGLVLLGALELGGAWMGWGQKWTQGHGLTASFFTGVLAAVVASPCTAPFMATAVGFAVTQDTLSGLLVFVGLGLGMAFPYLLLTYSPAVARALPHPGAWMDTLKQVLAFPLFFTAAWLLLVLGALTSSDASAWLVTGACAIAFAIWLLRVRGDSNVWLNFRRILALLAAVLALAIAIHIEHWSKRDLGVWQNYDPDQLTELRSKHTPVFVDLTADWCITCKVNERVALHTEDVENFATQHGIVLMVGDWTRKDEKISALLAKYERNGVPLYLMYPADSSQDAEVLPQLLTKGAVLEAMNKALE